MLQAASPSHRHTDLTYLREIANGSNDFIVEMLSIFIDQVPKSLARMETAAHDKDWPTVRMVAHKIKPSILFTGLTEIADEVPKLEQYAAEESHTDIIPLQVEKIKHVCTEAIVELKEELGKLSA